MLKFLKKSSTWAPSIITVVFTFVPEIIFGKFKLLSNVSDEVNVMLARVLAFVVVLVLSVIGNALYLHYRRKVRIKGHNYNIQIEYGNLLGMRACKKSN